MFFTATIKFTDGNTRYSSLVQSAGLIQWANRYGIKVMVDVNNGDIFTELNLPEDVASISYETLTEAQLSA